MMAEIIDSHVHLLDPGHLTYPWLAEEILPPSDAARYAAAAPAVTGVIVVEAGALATQADAETAWISSQAKAHPWILGVVAQAPAERPEALASCLAACRDDPLVVGIRRPPG